MNEPEELPELGFDTMPMIVQVDTPALADIPVKVQQIICLRACGFSSGSIAKALKTRTTEVNRLINTYDPEGQLTLSRRERKSFMASLWEATSAESLLHITPDKLEESSASDLAKIANIASKNAAAANLTDEDEARDPMKLIEAICGG